MEEITPDPNHAKLNANLARFRDPPPDFGSLAIKVTGRGFPPGHQPTQAEEYDVAAQLRQQAKQRHPDHLP